MRNRFKHLRKNKLKEDKLISYYECKTNLYILNLFTYAGIFHKFSNFYASDYSFIKHIRIFISSIKLDIDDNIENNFVSIIKKFRYFKNI